MNLVPKHHAINTLYCWDIKPCGAWFISINYIWFNPITAGKSMVHTQPCGRWSPGAKVPCFHTLNGDKLCIDSEIYLRCLGRISSRPGAPYLRLLMTSSISFMFVGFRENGDGRFSVRKFLWDLPPLVFLEEKVGPIITKKLLNPFAIAFPLIYC